MTHTITKSRVKGMRLSTLRATCSCGEFTSDVHRLSTPGRRKQERLIREHLDSVADDPVPAAALPGAASIEAAR